MVQESSTWYSFIIQMTTSLLRVYGRRNREDSKTFRLNIKTTNPYVITQIKYTPIEVAITCNALTKKPETRSSTSFNTPPYSYSEGVYAMFRVGATKLIDTEHLILPTYFAHAKSELERKRWDVNQGATELGVFTSDQIAHVKRNGFFLMVSREEAIH